VSTLSAPFLEHCVCHLIASLRNIYLFKHYDVTPRTYLHTRMIYTSSALSAPTRVTRAAAAAAAVSSSYVTRRSFHVSPPVNSPPFSFVGKRNRTCPSAHVRTSGCVSRVSTFDGTKDERRRKGRAMRQGGGGGTRVTCAEDLLRFTRGSRQKRLPPLPPLSPPARRPPATAPFSPSLPPPSSLILLLFLLYYDGLLHFHSDAGLKIKSLIHDA